MAHEAFDIAHEVLKETPAGRFLEHLFGGHHDLFDQQVAAEGGSGGEGAEETDGAYEVAVVRESWMIDDPSPVAENTATGAREYLINVRTTAEKNIALLEKVKDGVEIRGERTGVEIRTFDDPENIRWYIKQYQTLIDQVNDALERRITDTTAKGWVTSIYGEVEEIQNNPALRFVLSKASGESPIV